MRPYSTVQRSAQCETGRATRIPKASAELAQQLAQGTAAETAIRAARTDVVHPNTQQSSLVGFIISWVRY